MKKIFLSLVILSLVCTVCCIREDYEGQKPNVNNGGGGIGGGEEPVASFTVGQEYGGGIVAYVDDTKKHGIIAAPYDQSAGIQWYNGSYFATDATSDDGESNTKRIVQMQGNGNYAAKLCYDLVLNGYDDWYLPSKWELNQLYINRVEIGGFDYSNTLYWSSTETENNYYSANCQNFSNGNRGGNRKDEPFRVRAVRSF